MAQGDEKTPQTGDNPNKPGVGPNKGDLRPGDITWVTPPPGMEEHEGVLVPEGEGRRADDDGPTTLKALSKGQRRDLARRIRAKLSRKG